MFQKINSSNSVLNSLKNLLVSRWRFLLLVVIGVYSPLQVVAILTIKVLQHKDGFFWDVPILMAIHSTASSKLDAIAVVLTKWGSFWTAFPILSAISLVLLYKHRWKTFAYVSITAVGNLIINHTAKEIIQRSRPDLWVSKAPEFDYAFPSGHAMTSMTLVSILLILTWDRPYKWLIVTIGSSYLLVIAWTRLYLGVHFPSDIFAGWMVALAWAIGMSLIIKPNWHRVTVTHSQ
ncbi:MAG: phosphatase PAP2 family protein [Nostocales cyanobacterium]|nr:MAG: phosphatase PAP2 family protein [Nostocales cyanobacterium]TAF16832.1 MAG: phosphatase PAP2 family protein [Nostocales cyanobacterium]